MGSFDRRLTPARPDLAALHLQGIVTAGDFSRGSLAQIARPFVNVHPEPDTATSPDTQLLRGETVQIYERAPGWAWIQALTDGYVGYVVEDALSDMPSRLHSHRVRTLGTNCYAHPKLKSPVFDYLPFGAELSVLEELDGFSRVDTGYWVPSQHLAEARSPASDWVAVAEMFLGVPYVWGGRTNLGLDCSALVQLARLAGGYRCLRDSDMQYASEGVTLDEGDELHRGDLIFWRGHVGIMVDRENLLHANGYHMAVVRESLAEAVRRIAATEDSRVTRRARPGH